MRSILSFSGTVIMEEERLPPSPFLILGSPAHAAIPPCASCVAGKARRGLEPEGAAETNYIFCALNVWIHATQMPGF